LKKWKADEEQESLPMIHDEKRDDEELEHRWRCQATNTMWLDKCYLLKIYRGLEVS